MKLIVDLEKKSLRILENERSIFRGEYGADKLELYINKTLENEYPTITALLSNGRKIGPYSTDSAYSSETIDGVNYTIASFTLSKENGFTLSEGKMQITIWMNTSTGKKEAIGNVLLNVINTTAFDDGDIIISGDVEGTLVNYRVELENLGSQVNGFNGRLTNVETNKADRTELNATNDRITNVETNKLDKQTASTSSLYTTNEYIPTIPFGPDIKPLGVVSRDLQGRFEVAEPTADPHPTSKQYVDNNIAKKADKTELNATNNRVNSVETNKLDKKTSPNTLYGVDRYGNQTNFELDNGAMISGTIPKRDDTGQLNVPLTPTGNKHATSKKYVDDKIKDAKQFTTDSIDALIGGAPSTLDTLKELSDALKGNKDIVDVLEESIGKKADRSELFSGDYNDLTNKPNIPTALSDLKIDMEIGGNTATEITYAELKALRDNSQLVVGNTYIITDYQCTTTTANTKSAGHQFDIIVKATTNNLLDENAKVRHHKDDTYFSNNNLGAWELKYTIDNDSTKYEWADEVNGKGVIYYMKDEYNNEVPYDFKNILYVFKKSFVYTQWGGEYTFSRKNDMDTTVDGVKYYAYEGDTTPSAWNDNICYLIDETPTTTSVMYSSSFSEITYGGSILSVNFDEYNAYTFNSADKEAYKDNSIDGSSYNINITSYLETKYTDEGNFKVQILNKNICFSSDTITIKQSYNNRIKFCQNLILDVECNNNIFNYFNGSTLRNSSNNEIIISSNSCILENVMYCSFDNINNTKIENSHHVISNSTIDSCSILNCAYLNLVMREAGTSYGNYNFDKCDFKGCTDFSIEFDYEAPVVLGDSFRNFEFNGLTSTILKHSERYNNTEYILELDKMYKTYIGHYEYGELAIIDDIPTSSRYIRPSDNVWKKAS